MVIVLIIVTVLAERQAADLRGAHGREVRGVAEEDGPAVLTVAEWIVIKTTEHH